MTIAVTDSRPTAAEAAGIAADRLMSIAVAADILEAGQRRTRELVGMTIVLLNVFDVLITRLVLRTHPASHEGNGIMAQLIMSRWVWLPKAGIPLLVLFSTARSPMTKVSYFGVFAVAAVYWSVVVWNLHILFR